QVQNVGNTEVTAFVSFYRDGALVNTQPAATIAVGASKTYFLPALDGLGDGFSGSAVVGATGPVAAIVNQVNYNLNGTGKSGSTAFNAIRQSDTGPTVWLPGLRLGGAIVILNLGSSATPVRVTYYGADGRTIRSDESTVTNGGSLSVDARGAIGSG